MAAGDAPAERTTLADEVVLADELGEGPGRIRAASGWRSGGGWNRASGRAPPARATGVRRVGTPPMVRRRSTYRVNRWRPFTRTSRTARIPSRKPPTRMIRRTSRWT